MEKSSPAVFIIEPQSDSNKASDLYKCKSPVQETQRISSQAQDPGCKISPPSVIDHPAVQESQRIEDSGYTSELALSTRSTLKHKITLQDVGGRINPTIAESVEEEVKASESDNCYTPASEKKEFVIHLRESRIKLSRFFRKTNNTKRVRSSNLRAIKTVKKVLRDRSGIKFACRLVSPQSNYSYRVQVEAIVHNFRALCDLSKTHQEVEFDAETKVATCEIMMPDSKTAQQHNRRDIEIIVRATVCGSN